MANVIVAPGQPPVVAATATQAPYVQPEPYPGEKYKKTYKTLGIIQVVVGVLSIILAIVNLGIETNGYFYRTVGLTLVSCGIWTGALALTAGILGILCGSKTDSCRVTGAMIVTIFAAIAAGLMFSVETPAAVYAGGYSYYGASSTTAIHAILSALAFIEFVVAIVHSAYCCAVGCCHTYTGHVLGPTQTIVTTTAYPNQMQVTALPGQQIHYVQQPGYTTVQPGYNIQQQQPMLQQQQQQQQQQQYPSSPAQPVYANNQSPPPQYAEKTPY